MDFPQDQIWVETSSGGELKLTFYEVESNLNISVRFHDETPQIARYYYNESYVPKPVEIPNRIDNVQSDANSLVEKQGSLNTDVPDFNETVVLAEHRPLHSHSFQEHVVLPEMHEQELPLASSLLHTIIPRLAHGVPVQGISIATYNR